MGNTISQRLDFIITIILNLLARRFGGLPGSASGYNMTDPPFILAFYPSHFEEMTQILSNMQYRRLGLVRTRNPSESTCSLDPIHMHACMSYVGGPIWNRQVCLQTVKQAKESAGCVLSALGDLALTSAYFLLSLLACYLLGPSW